MTSKPTISESDSAQLEALGYDSNFDRSMSLWSNFALGFTYLSPVVGVYTVFAFAIATGGPPMFWSYLFVGLGQLLVAIVFGEIVSQFPIAGGLYPWARRLVGKRWAWMAGWVYLWALCTTIAAVAVGGAPYLAQLLGIQVGQVGEVAIAVTLIVVTTALNVSGTKLLARVAMFGFICELLGAVVVGGYLLVAARHQSFGVLFHSFGLGSNGHYLPAFLASSVAAMFCYYGFEACGDVAEETPDASRAIPKAMRMTIYIGGFAAIQATIVLGQNDFNHTGCNHDSNWQNYWETSNHLGPAPDGTCLCGLNYNTQSPAESGSVANMMVDGQGNLYVPDYYNNRILRYDWPITQNGQSAQYVWGQPNLAGSAFNNSGGGSPNATDLWFYSLSGNAVPAGVAIDSWGNLWVADTDNTQKGPTGCKGMSKLPSASIGSE